jgi:hypothetical protein
MTEQRVTGVENLVRLGGLGGEGTRRPWLRRSWLELTVALALAACTIGARAPLLHYPFWEDEVGTARVIQEPTARAALRQVVVREATPPAYYLTAWFVDRIKTQFIPESVPGEWLRGLSVLFSVGTTLLTFWLALRFLPLWAAGLAGVMVSFSSELVAHGAELRSYSLLAFASVLFATALLRAADHPRLRRLSALAATVVLGSLTHYFFALTVASGVVWIASAVRPRTTAVRLLSAIAVGLVPLVIWSPYGWRQYQAGNFGVSPRFTPHRLVDAFDMLFAPLRVVDEVGPAIRGALLLLAVGSAVLLLFRHRFAGRLVAILVLLPLVVITGVGALGPRIVNSRNLISLVPFAAIAVVWICTALPWRGVGKGAALSLSLLIVASYGVSQSQLGRTPSDRIARAIAEQGFSHGEPVVWFGEWGGQIPIGWYLVKPTADSPSSSGLVAARPDAAGTCPAVEVVARSRAGRIWIGQHQDEILARASTPSYGGKMLGQRLPSDTWIIRLRWSPGILDRARKAKGMIFRRYDIPWPCKSREPE